jgi:Tfp pilus assembly protein PilN
MVVAGLALLASCAITGARVASAGAEAQVLASRLDTAREYSTALALGVGRARESETRSREAEASLAKLERFRASRTDVCVLLDAIVDGLPKGVRLDKFVLDGNLLAVSGRANSGEAVAELIKVLEDRSALVRNITWNVDRTVAGTWDERTRSETERVVHGFSIRGELLRGQGASWPDNPERT